MLGCICSLLRCSVQGAQNLGCRHNTRHLFSTDNSVISKTMRSRIKELFRKVHPDLFSYDPKVQVCDWQRLPVLSNKIAKWSLN